MTGLPIENIQPISIYLQGILCLQDIPESVNENKILYALRGNYKPRDNPPKDKMTAKINSMLYLLYLEMKWKKHLILLAHTEKWKNSTPTTTQNRQSLQNQQTDKLAAERPK
jgi:hypothetical protein